MTLSVADQGIDRPQRLSERARLVLGLVDGGRQWLQWAIRHHQARYHFEDEDALVVGTQTILHATRLMLLPRLRLWISPIKLMTLSLAELRVFARAEDRPGGSARAGVAQVFRDHQLLTNSELDGAAALLRALKVADAPLFQCMTLRDRLAIVALLGQPASGEAPVVGLRQEAAAFAVEQSRTPLEFVDYYRAYLNLAAETPLGAPEQRRARAEAALATLLPVLFDELDGPRVDGLAPPAREFSAATEEWLMLGRRLGFSRLSRGVQQVIAHAGLTGDGNDKAERAAAYLAGAQALLTSGKLDSGRIGQDGIWTFRTTSQTHELKVVALPSGVIALSAFRRLPL